MSRVYNFSAGPAVLPEEVLKEAADEMMDYRGCGMSVMDCAFPFFLFPLISHELLHALAFGARIVGTITFQQVYDTPHAQASAESHNKGLQSINSGRKELHIASISPGFSPAMKKAAHTGGRLRPLDTLSRSGIYTKASGSSTSS